MSFFGWHISFEYLYFKSRRKEWSVRVWRNVKYHRPPPRPAKFIPSFKGETKNMVSGVGQTNTYVPYKLEPEEGTDGIIEQN